MSWQRKQYEQTGGRFRKIRRGEKDWSRNDKEAIRQYEERYGTPQQREGQHEGTDQREAA